MPSGLGWVPNVGLTDSTHAAGGHWIDPEASSPRAGIGENLPAG